MFRIILPLAGLLKNTLKKQISETVYPLRLTIW